MNIYVMLYFVLIFNVFLSHGLSERGRKGLYFISACYLILVVVLRNPIDYNWPDTSNYLGTFKYLNNSITWKQVWNTGWEPGVVVIAKIINLFFTDNQAYIMILGLMILIPVFMMIYKYCELPIMGLITFYAMGFLTMTSIYRQWLAIGILACSIKYIYERDLKKFLLLILLAFLFHRTAVLFVVVYFIYNLKLNNTLIFWSIIISFGLYVAGAPILNVLNRYARMEQVAEQNGGVTLLIVLWICVIVSYYFGRNHLDDPSFRLPLNIVLIAAVIQPISFTFSLWSRVVYYFSLYLVLLLPKTIKNILQNANNMKLWFLIENVYMIVMFGWFAVGGLPEYIPLWG